MTRKDYELIAEAMRGALVYRDRASYPSAFIHGHEAATYAIANALQANNPRFDRVKFMDAIYGEVEEY